MPLRVILPALSILVSFLASSMQLRKVSGGPAMPASSNIALFQNIAGVLNSSGRP